LRVIDSELINSISNSLTQDAMNASVEARQAIAKAEGA
jgi:hypothetical protein